MKVTDPPVVVTQTFNRSIHDVWNAITQLDPMQQWFFNQIPDFNPILHFETQFVITNEGRQFTHVWKIIEVIPAKRITYHWSYLEYSGSATVNFELQEGDQKTTLTVTNTILEDFPQDIPEFKQESCIGGWTYLIKQQLVSFLKP